MSLVDPGLRPLPAPPAPAPPVPADALRALVPDAACGVDAELRDMLARAAALEAEVERLSRSLSDFDERYAAHVGAARDEVHAVVRLARRLEALETELHGLLARVRAPRVRRGARVPRAPNASGDPGVPAATTARRSSRPPGPPSARPHDAAPDAEARADAEPDDRDPAAAPLKQLYRRLALALHPDRARTEEERGRRSAMMSMLNVAFDREDRVRLELIAAHVDTATADADASAEEHAARARRHAEAVARLVASLERERARLTTSPAFRLRQEAEARAAAGADYFAEEAAAIRDRGRAASADVRERLARVSAACRELGAALRAGPTAFPPSPFVRRRRAAAERPSLTPAGRRLADRLVASAPIAPWTVALTCVAFFAEVSGRPPEGVDVATGLKERYDGVRWGWAGAPPFERALAELPGDLELGVCAGRRGLRFGVFLRDPGLLGGVRAAFANESVAAIARAVLGALGPKVTCRGCGRTVFLTHVLRTDGLDTVHALACARCAFVDHRYRLMGAPEGLEALNRYAVDLGVVKEQVVQLAHGSLAFQFLPCERKGLTFRTLRERFAETYLSPGPAGVDPRHLGAFVGGSQAAAPVDERVPDGAVVRLRVDEAAGLSDDELWARLREAVERRFRPE